MTAQPRVGKTGPTSAASSRRAPARRAPPAAARGATPESPRWVLNLAWGALTAGALLSGSVVLGLWLAATAALAGAQSARTWKKGDSQPLAAAAAGAAGVMVAGAGFGPAGLVVGGVAGSAGAVAWAIADHKDVARTLLCAAAPAVAAVGPVLLRATDGLVPALVLLAYAAAYDIGSSVMGNRARFRWEGPFFGAACIASVTLAVAAVFPQFKGDQPWQLGALAAVLAVGGPWVGRLVVRGGRARVPALRRLDSLLLLGPVWAIAAAAVLA